MSRQIENVHRAVPHSHAIVRQLDRNRLNVGRYPTMCALDGLLEF
jgi:hypothetical protein